MSNISNGGTPSSQPQQTQQPYDPRLITLQELERNIDTTRRARMNASNRLMSFERFIQAVNIYYSCFAAIISIFSLVYADKSLSIISAISTSILAISIVYLNAQHFGERAQQFRNNFHDLYQLLFDVKHAILEADFSKTRDLEKCYIDLLKSVENHTNYDFLNTLHLRDRREKRKNKKGYKNRLSGFERTAYQLYKIGALLLKWLIWLLPIACLVFVAVTILSHSTPVALTP